jgi:hypothetical protein
MRVIVLECRRRVAGVAGVVEGFKDDDLRFRMGFPLSSAWEAQDSIVSLAGICTFAVYAQGPGSYHLIGALSLDNRSVTVGQVTRCRVLRPVSQDLLVPAPLSFRVDRSSVAVQAK